MWPSRSGNSRTSSAAWSTLASLATSKGFDKCYETFGFLREGACPGDEGDGAELLQQALDSSREVPLEGEGRILEPALEHVLVTGDHGLGVTAVRHEGEAVPAQREVALVGFHRGDDHPFWQLQKSFVEIPREDHRALDEIDHLRQDAFVGLLESQSA